MIRYNFYAAVDANGFLFPARGFKPRVGSLRPAQHYVHGFTQCTRSVGFAEDLRVECTLLIF
jgi:hypothetical protein